MKIVDQNSAAAALEKVLIPSPSLIDGRTEADRLSFLCNFASLINFYDQTNRINGNWQPFLLKDPVLLLAHISKTDFSKEYKLFVLTCANIQNYFTPQSGTMVKNQSDVPRSPDDIIHLLNQLFDRIIGIFLRIESWTHFMQMGSEEYDLKKYVITQVKTKFNAYLWAILSLREYLSSQPDIVTGSQKQITPVRETILSSFSDLIWTKGAGTIPFMQVLGLYTIDEVKKAPADEEPTGGGPIPFGITITLQEYFGGIKNIGEEVFKFYRTIVHHASAGYEEVKNTKSRYPDTVLIRTFGNLLEIHREELNLIANKHLQFYYRNILKQSEQPAVADSVFISAVLGKNITVFDLPAGTSFSAGTDAAKKPIYYTSKADVSLNAAAISSVYTLAALTPSVTASQADGTTDPTFANDGIGNNTITSIALQCDGKIVITGSFTQFGSSVTNGIARLNADGSLDTTFTVGIGSGPGAGDIINTCAVQCDGKILIGGNISSFNKTAVSNIVRLNSDGTLDTIPLNTLSNPTNASFNSNAQGTVNCISLQHDESILIAGEFNPKEPISLVVRLTTDGIQDNTFHFDEGVSGDIQIMLLQKDGQILIGGQFTNVPGISANCLLRLSSTGVHDTTFKVTNIVFDTITSCVLQSNQKIIVAGESTITGSPGTSVVARLNSDGTLDTSFKIVNLGQDNVLSCAIQWDGKIIIAGSFSTINGIPAKSISRLHADGSIDSSFKTDSAKDFTSLTHSLIQSNGQIIVAGICRENTTSCKVVRVNTLMNPPQLLLQTIATPGVLATNESGQTLSWNTFGGTINEDLSPASIKQMGFAFASPMLFLQEGSRQIIIDFVFEVLPEINLFNNAEFFLSTAKGWLSVPYSIFPTDPDGYTLTVEIVLNSTQPAIVPFTVNPDGLNSDWPMLKVTLDSFLGLSTSTPPTLTAIDIVVCVQGVNTFALYNDNGLLSSKTPFQLFGPLVNINSNFLIGSSEIFSKPFDWLTLELDWDTLPQPPQPPATPATQKSTTPAAKNPLDTGFGTYYNSYNAVLFSPTEKAQSLEVQTEFSPQKKTPQRKTTSTSINPPSGQKADEPKISPGMVTRLFKAFLKILTWPFRIFFASLIWFFGLFSKKHTPAVPTAHLETEQYITSATADMIPSFVPPAPPVQSQSIPFCNTAFTVEFGILNHHAWDTFYMYNYTMNSSFINWLNNPIAPAIITPETGVAPFQLFVTDTEGNNLGVKSVFGYFASEYDTPPDVNPIIQNTPLVFDGTNASGFIRMTLTNPLNGFGVSVYPNVVASIATANSLSISGNWPWNKVDPSSLISPANIPFAPKVKAISGNYGAFQSYDLTKARETYPIQYFYYTPFANYKAYDNSPVIKTNYAPENSLTGQPVAAKGLPLVPSFVCNDETNAYKIHSCDGAMFIGLSGLAPSNTISLYFELSTTYAAPTPGAQVTYYYLSNNGWKLLPVVKDGTNQFTCSGIITLNIPSDITNQSAAMPGSLFWISIGASIDPSSGQALDLSSFAQVVLLAPNGIELTRSGSEYLTDTTAPVISSLTITKPQFAIPQLSTITQPFPSFAGRGAEDLQQMYQRVSTRIKSKDRAVSCGDIFNIIREQFPDIYYSHANYSAETNLTSVFVAEGFSGSADANAYRPFVSECEIESITRFLNKRVSLFSNISVSNFNYQPVQVNATITVKTGYVPQTMCGTVSQALMNYFSPWIANTNQQQVAIGQPITQTQVASFIRNIPGIAAVTDVTLKIIGQDSEVVQQTISPQNGCLFVTSRKHVINASQEK